MPNYLSLSSLFALPSFDNEFTPNGSPINPFNGTSSFTNAVIPDVFVLTLSPPKDKDLFNNSLFVNRRRNTPLA